MILSEDELLIMVSKANEEALVLLFSIYEKKMSFESRNFGKIIGNSFGYEDCLQEMRLHFLKLISDYDYTKGRLYSFWLNAYKYPFIERLEKANLLVLFDAELETKVSVSYYENKDGDIAILSKYLKELAEDNKIIFSALYLWAQGYSHAEISKILSYSVTQVNYLIRRGIAILKKKINK